MMDPLLYGGMIHQASFDHQSVTGRIRSFCNAAPLVRLFLKPFLGYSPEYRFFKNLKSSSLKFFGAAEGPAQDGNTLDGSYTCRNSIIIFKAFFVIVALASSGIAGSENDHAEVVSY
jgi:hypothetical protein